MWTTRPNLEFRALWSWAARLCVALVMVGAILSASAQVLPRPARARKIQKRIERLEQQQERQQQKSLTEPPAGSSTATSVADKSAPTGTRPNNLAGINQSRDITQLLTPEQRSLVIRGFGRAPALVMIFSQLNLTDGQKNEIRAISRRVGNRLVLSQQELLRLNNELELAIYGDEFSAARVDELAAQVADKQAEVIKLRSNIEAQVRQVLTLDQLFAYRFLLNEMAVSGARRPALQLLRQQQRRNGAVPPARQNQPPPNNDDDDQPR